MPRILWSSALLLALVPAIVVGAGEETAVADAVMHRDVAGLRALLARKADVNGPQPDGSTALHWAVYWNDLTAADLLIKAGATPAASTRLGATPLFIAVQSRTPAMVSRLLAAGADVNAPFLSNGETPLMVAARSGNIETVKLLLDAKADINAKETLRETTALSWAAEENHADVVALLLSRGADPKIPMTDGTTSLMTLAGVGHGDGFTKDFGTPDDTFAALQILVEAGVPINAANSSEVTALHGAAHKNFVRGIQYLVDHGADMTMVSHYTAPDGFVRVGSKGQSVLDWATGVMVNGQSSSYKTEAVELVTKLMKERGMSMENLTNTRGGLNATPRSPRQFPSAS